MRILDRPEIDLFDWKKSFANTSVEEKVATFNKSILHILHNFIPHETLLVDDKDPTWVTNKKTHHQKNTFFKYYRQNSNTLQISNKLESLQNVLTKSITDSKRNYYPGIADKLHTT